MEMVVVDVAVHGQDQDQGFLCLNETNKSSFVFLNAAINLKKNFFFFCYFIVNCAEIEVVKDVAAIVDHVRVAVTVIIAEIVPICIKIWLIRIIKMIEIGILI